MALPYVIVIHPITYEMFKKGITIRTLFSWVNMSLLFVRKDDERRICNNSMAFDDFGVRVESCLLQMCGVIVKME